MAERPALPNPKWQRSQKSQHGAEKHSKNPNTGGIRLCRTLTPVRSRASRT
nr:MAG TPA: hypothetical protein [Caudoviricetes sp.]